MSAFLVKNGDKVLMSVPTSFKGGRVSKSHIHVLPPGIRQALICPRLDLNGC